MSLRRLSLRCLGPRGPRAWSVLLVCLLLSACGSERAATPEDQGRARALALVNQLRDAGLPVEDIVVCTSPAPAPAGHSRPPAVAFDDSRIATGANRHVVREGGVVEVYDSAEQAQSRVRELVAQTLVAQEYGFDEGGHAISAEGRFPVGSVLLRLSGALPGEATQKYVAALKKAPEAAPDISLLDNALEAPCST